MRMFEKKSVQHGLNFFVGLFKPRSHLYRCLANFKWKGILTHMNSAHMNARKKLNKYKTHALKMDETKKILHKKLGDAQRPHEAETVCIHTQTKK